MPIDTTPIFTNIGLNKIASAILTETNIELTTIKVGDSMPDLDRIPLVTDTDIQNFVANTNVSSIHYVDLEKSNGTALRIKGKINYQDSQDYIIREYGVYDKDNDLIIVGRVTEAEMKNPLDIRTELEIVINIAVSDMQKAFITNNLPDSEYVSIEDLEDHINEKNPHNLTKSTFYLDKATNTSDLDKPTHPYIAQLLYVTKLGLGFAKRTNSKITKSGNVITLTPTENVTVYKRGVKHIISSPISIDVSTRISENGVDYPLGYLGGFYVGYNPDEHKLYAIVGNPDFENDILVTWFYRNRTQGIIWLADERHAASRNVHEHRLHHLEVGTVWLDGGLLITELNNPLNNKLTITTPISIADEDLNFTISDVENPTLPYEQKLTNAKLPVLYLDNNGEYVVSNNNNTDVNWLYNANGAVYNNTTTGTLDSVASGKFICYWMLFTTDQSEPVKLLLGRAVHDTLDNAGAETLQGLGLPMPELVGAYKIVLSVNSTNDNLAKTRIHKVFEISNSIKGSSIKLNSHTLLAGRDNEGQHTTNAISGLTKALEEAGKIRKAQMIGTVKSDITEVDNNGKITLDTFMSDGRKMVYRDDPVFVDAFGASLGTASYKYAAGVLAPNGKIYYAPLNANKVLEIDPVTKTWAYIGADYGATEYKWYSACLAKNGKIYAAPYSANNFLEIDPVTGTTTLVGVSYAAYGFNKWLGIVLAPNGKLYCIPHASATRVLEFDPVTKTGTLIGATYNVDQKWWGTVLAKNGKIYSSSFLYNTILEVNPETKSTRVITIPAALATIGACLAPNGKIYFIQRQSQYALWEFNPENDTIVKISNLSGGPFIFPTVGADGKIYALESNNSSSKLLRFDCDTKEIEILNIKHSNMNYVFGELILAANGKLYACSNNAPNVLEIDTFEKSTDFQSYLKLPV